MSLKRCIKGLGKNWQGKGHEGWGNLQNAMSGFKSVNQVNQEPTFQQIDKAFSVVDSSARLVPGRLVRRLVVRLRDLDGLVLMVSHGWGLAVRTRDALQFASSHELLLAPAGPIPDWLMLVSRPSDRFLASLSETACQDWLKGKLVHLSADRAFGQARLLNSSASLGLRNQLDERVWEEVVSVLAEEKRLLPGACGAEEEEEFLATALELSLVDPPALKLWFPSVNQEWLLGLLASLPILDESRALAHKCDSLQVGGILESQDIPNTDCHQLANRLISCLPRYESSHCSIELARALMPVFHNARVDGQRSARCLLEDLEQVVKLAGTPLEKVDAFRWILSLGKEPLRRELPYSGWLMALRSLRSATAQVGKLGLAAHQTELLLEHLGRWHQAATGALRDQVGPVIEATFRKTGLIPERVLEGLAWRQVVDELLERLANRGEIALGDLRDALASHRMKLADLKGPVEWLKGDLLLRVDRKLAQDLPGAYRPGEFYMRGLQRLSSLFFGNPLGRAIFLYLLFPLAIVYVAFKGVQELANLALSVTFEKKLALEALDASLANARWLPLEAELTDKKAELVLGGPWTYFILAAFVSLLIYSPLLRKRCARFLWKAGGVLHGVLIDFPALLLRGIWMLVRLPYIRQIYQHGVRPGMEAVAAMLLLRWVGWLPPAGDGLWVVVFAGFVGLFLSTPWRFVEEMGMDMAAWVWQHLGLALVLSVFDWIIAVFRWLMELVSLWLRGLDRLLLQPPSGRGGGLAARCVVSLIISPFVYIVRAVLLIFVEPQVNPVKHFPVVTVGHKLMLTMAPGIASSISASTGKNYFEVLTAVTSILTLIPGFLGFLAWELKENWRLYKANQAKYVRPVMFGGHGESMKGMLAPGFHSGTLPKLFRRLRRADPVSRVILAEALNHDEHLIHGFFQEELVEVWRLCPGVPELSIKAVKVGPRHVEAVLSLEGHGPFVLTLAWRGWWMEALVGIPEVEHQLREKLELLVEGLWQKAGALVARADWDKAIPDLTSLGSESGSIRVFNKQGHHADYPTDGLGLLTPSKPGWPNLKPAKVLLSARPMPFADWDAAWEKYAIEGTESFGGA